MENLNTLLAHHRLFHTQYQHDNFITKRAGGTLYGQYKQSLRELYSRIRGIRDGWYRLKKAQIEMSEKELEIKEVVATAANETDPISKQKLELKTQILELDLKHMQMAQEENTRVVKETVEELRRFYAQADWLYKQLVAQYGDLTPEILYQLDKEMWIYKAKEKMAVDYLANGRLSNTTFELIVSMPETEKKTIYKQIKEGGPQSFIAWYETTMERPQIPEDLPLPTTQDLLQAMPNDLPRLLE